MPKYVYDFAEGNKDLKDLLGGKGANLAEMTNLGLPVPPGFTITTEACRAYLADGRRAGRAGRRGDASTWRPGGARWASGSATARRPAAGVGAVRGEVLDARDDGDRPEHRAERPVRARAGGAVGQRAVRVGLLPPADPDVRQDRAAASTGSAFEEAFDAAKRAQGRRPDDLDLDAADLQELVETFKDDRRRARRPRVPAGPARAAGPRRSTRCSSRGTPTGRVLYRRQERIPDDLGTAVNIVAMVFGNLGPDSGTGVAFTRDPATGAPGRLRRLPAERPGRGRRRRDPQHRAAGRSGADRQALLRRADADHATPGGALPGPVRHRVHHRARQAVDAADPGRQADRGGGVPDRRRSSSTRA